MSGFPVAQIRDLQDMNFTAITMLSVQMMRCHSHQNTILSSSFKEYRDMVLQNYHALLDACLMFDGSTGKKELITDLQTSFKTACEAIKSLRSTHVTAIGKSMNGVVSDFEKLLEEISKEKPRSTRIKALMELIPRVITFVKEMNRAVMGLCIKEKTEERDQFRAKIFGLEDVYTYCACIVPELREIGLKDTDAGVMDFCLVNISHWIDMVKDDLDKKVGCSMQSIEQACTALKNSMGQSSNEVQSSRELLAVFFYGEGSNFFFLFCFGKDSNC